MSASNSAQGQRHRVVVIGGGFGGLQAAKHLATASVDLTIVDRRNFHLFQPLTYEVATGALSPGEVAYPLRAVFRRHRNVRVVMAEVTGFDLEGRRVQLAEGSLPYDTLIVAGGSHYSYFGHDDWRIYAPEVKSLESALATRARLLKAFEDAETEPDPDRRRALLTFVVVGAGPTGVEMAGQIAELARGTLRDEFRSIDSRQSRVVLIGTFDRVLTTFPPSLSRKAARSLDSLGVTLLLQRTVVDIDEESVTVAAPDGSTERIPTRNAIWAAGVEASRLAAQLGKMSGADVDRAGRVTIEPDLTLPRPPRGRGARRHGPRTQPRRRPPSAPRRRAGRDATGPLRGQARSRAPQGPGNRAFPLPRQGQPRDDRPRPRGSRPPRHPPERLPRLGDLAGGAPLLPDRLPEPPDRRHPLVHQLRQPRPRRPAHHQHPRRRGRSAVAAINGVPGLAVPALSGLRN